MAIYQEKPQLNKYNLGLDIIDPEVFEIIGREKQRQNNNIELIASANFASRAVLEATGSILTNKVAEGYPGRRYFSGCENIDELENLAIDRARDSPVAIFPWVQ